ncbi:protein JINGUBANG-like [Telopea speciosissima]|uniref:protein JINGUBANG-like n=1 Tax=Telopea speciosissima TaxID=54955 RepID=UPI001CC681EB|nr:protein JINGUBANG-like [Telopea speciosissima]
MATCSSASTTSTADGAAISFHPKHVELPSPNLLASDASSSSEILSLPSVPSLQTTCSETQDNVSVSYLCISILKPQTHQVSCLAVSGDLLYAASGNEINVFTLTNYQHIDAFNVKDSSSGSVKSLAFGEGKVFSAHQDCKIRVWVMTPTKQHQLVATLPTVKDWLRRFMMPKNYVRLRRHKKRLWIEHVDAVSGLALTDGLLYSVSWDKSLKIWRTWNLRCLESMKAHDDAINAVAVSADGTIYTASADRRIRVWGRTTGKRSQRHERHRLIATLEKHNSAVNALALSSDGSVLFSGAGDRSILVWERKDSANHMGVTGALRGHKGAILCLVNVSEILVSGSADRTVRIWKRGGGGDQRYSHLVVLEGHERPVKSLVAVMGGVVVSSSSGSGSGSGSEKLSVCSGSLDGEVRVWEVTVSNLTHNASPTDQTNITLNS